MTLNKLRGLLAKASPLPWRDDDCHFASGPLRDERHRLIMANIESGEGNVGNHPDSPYGDYSMGYVGTTCQGRGEQADADVEFLCAAINALPGLLDVARAAKAVVREERMKLQHARGSRALVELSRAVRALDGEVKNA
jgi:hypothetical protein